MSLSYQAELKHARICMLATLGFVASGFVQLPGEMHQVSAVAAHNAAVQTGKRRRERVRGR